MSETVALLRAMPWMLLPYTWHGPGEEAVGLPPFSVAPIPCTCSPEAAEVLGKILSEIAMALRANSSTGLIIQAFTW